MRTITTVLGVATGLAACGKKSDPPPAPRAAVDARIATTAPPDAAPPPAPIVVTDPGRAFAHASGVLQIDTAGKVTTVVPDAELARAITTDRDGDLWVLAIPGKVTAYKGTARPRTVKLRSDVADEAAIASAAAGGVWVLQRDSLYRVAADLKVAKHGLPAEIPEPDGAGKGRRVLGPVALLEVDGDAWIAGEDGVYRYVAATKTWQRLREGRHAHLARVGTGPVWSARETSLVGIEVIPDAVAAYELALPGNLFASALAAGSEHLYALLVDRGGKGAQIAAARSAGATSAWVNPTLVTGRAIRDPMIVDGAGRIWVGADNGLLVVGPSGNVLADLPNGTVPGLVGSAVYDLAIVRQGPTTLPVAGARGTVTVGGRITTDGTQPAANLTLDVCVDDCTGAAPYWTIVTGADGAFEVAGVPITEYANVRHQRASAVVIIGGGLTKAGGNPRAAAEQFTCCLQAQPGGRIDAGTLVFRDVGPP